MRLINYFIISFILFSVVGCIEKQTSQKSEDIDVIDEPKIIRDTVIVREAITPTIEESVEAKETTGQDQATTATGRSRVKDDSYDYNNSGFFDSYKENYKGDPNQNLKTTRTVRTVMPENADEINRKRETLERTLDVLEKRNQQEKERQEQLEKERKNYNQKAEQEAREQQGKTLDTDLLLRR